MPTSRAVDPNKPAYRNAWYNALAALLPAGQAVDRLAARFGSFANTVQTRLDTSSGSGPSLGGTLEAQVDRALAQVLRQTPGLSMNGSSGSPSIAGGLSVSTLIGGAGGPPAIAPRQAALVREATLLKNDLLSILDTLQPLSTFADPSDVTAVTSVIRTEVNQLSEEFARATLRPRAQRVRVLLGGLIGWNPILPLTPPTGDTGTLVTLLNLGGPLVPTLLVEQQLASQDVLIGDSGEFLNQWEAFRVTEPPGVYPPLWSPAVTARVLPPNGLGNLGPRPGVPPTMALGPANAQALFRTAVINPGPVGAAVLSYAERLVQANLLLPVVAQDAGRVAGALDAIGLSSGEQETIFLDLQSLVDMDLLPAPLPPPPPAPPLVNSVVPVHTTVTDILDWTASMGDAKALDLIRQAGQLGLNLLADQADELFWLVVALLDPAAQAQMQELGDAQVQQELLSLARDLNALANLAV
jgi:hypothetical protein